MKCLEECAFFSCFSEARLLLTGGKAGQTAGLGKTGQSDGQDSGEEEKVGEGGQVEIKWDKQPAQYVTVPPPPPTHFWKIRLGGWWG